MINMFNEKIFVFFWWWFVRKKCAKKFIDNWKPKFVLVLAIANALSFVWWAVKILAPSRGRDFVWPYLHASSDVQPDEVVMIDKFVRTALRPDGIFLLKLISSNAGDLVVTDVLEEMWHDFKERRQQPYAAPLPPSKTHPDEGYNTGKYTAKPVE